MLVLQEGKQVTDLIKDAKKIAIVPVRSDSEDILSASVGFFRALKGSGKDVSLLYPYSFSDQFSQYLKKDEVTAVVGTRSLLVSVDCSNTPQIKGAKHYVEGEFLRMLIYNVPKDFDIEGKVHFSTVGFDYDLVITLGAQKLADIGPIFREFEDLFEGVTVINLDNSSKNEHFGTINVVEPDTESLCQLMLYKLGSWNYKVDKEIAKVLLYGISSMNSVEAPKPANQ